MKLVTYPDRDIAMLGVADALSSALHDALGLSDNASLCVPGGTTPGPVFDILSGLHLPWEQITVFPGDERWVPEDHPRSNARLIRKRLLCGQAERAAFVSLYDDTPEPEAAVDRISARLAPHLPISVLLLGMGADMHTASLFPGAEGLADALAPDAPILLPLRPHAATEVRVSLSARVLQGALNTHILITGADKRAALDKAQHLSPLEAPVRAVLSGATVHWAE